MPLCGHLLVATAVTIWGGVLVNCQKPSSVSKRHDVYIAGFFPFSPEMLPETATGRGVMPAVKLAIEHINENTAVLRNYRLHMWWNDTQCNASVGVKAFFDMMYEEPHKLMLFGTACTQVTDPIAKASKHWHITQLSYADTDPMFTSSNFPNFFRMVPSENAFNTPRIKLLQYFNWTQVGTIYQNEPRFSLAHNRLLAELDTMNFTVLETQSLTTNVSIAVERLKEKDVRIILGNFNESWAKRIFCEAYRVGMVGRKYQWLIMGTYGEQWWEEEQDSPCSSSELIEALEGCILTDYLPLASRNVITISGVTPIEYQLEYDSRRGNEYSRFHGYTYDGIWTAALAIQHAAHRIRSMRKNKTIVDFRYRDKTWEKLFVEALRNTSFEGVTGPVRFYDNERKANILLKQFQNKEEVKVGEYNGLTEMLDLGSGSAIRWKDGRGPPKDRTLLVFENSHVNFGLYFTLVVFSIIGIITATVFLIINIKYRNQRYIKMSSPYLNNLIIIGCILTYTSVIFLGLDSSLTSVHTFPYICAARAWLLMAGFSLAFGAMFSKTWRVHSIFTDVKLNKKVIKDYQLFMVVGVLLAFDVGIMTTWQITDPFYRATKNMESYIDSNSDDIQIIPVNEYCQSNKMTWFVGFIYAYKGLLMIFGAFLAWETRHVSIPALNDSKYVGMSVYNVVLMCIMGAAISFVLSDQRNYSFGIISVFILFCSTITVCLVFVPKVVELRRNPQGSIDKRIRATLRPMSKTRRESSELEEHFKHAKTTNQKYRKLLQEKDNELQNLLRKFNIEEQTQWPPTSKAPQSTTQEDSLLTRKEAPSATETTELSSGCSAISSTEIEAFTTSDSNLPASKRKTTFTSSKICSISTDDSLTIIKENESGLRGNSSYSRPPDESPPPKPNTVGTTRRRSNTSIAQSQSQSQSIAQLQANQSLQQSSPPPLQQQQQQQHLYTCTSARRTSMPSKRNSPAFVHQDELWLTQRQCKPKCLLNDGTPPSDDEDRSIMHRSVSEKSRDKCAHQHHRHHHHHHHHHHSSGSSSECQGSGGGMRKLAPPHVQSTPNVLGTALSDEKLVDLAILPIFQKLLTERRGAAIASCPNIAIKCDIVEYL